MNVSRIICVAIALACMATASAEVVAMHANVRDENLSLARVRDMFLGRVTTWNDGSPIVIVLVDDPVADKSLQKVTGRELARLIRGWKRLVYTGNGAMPLIAASSREALEIVALHNGALVILPSATADPRWRVVTLADEATR